MITLAKLNYSKDGKSYTRDKRADGDQDFNGRVDGFNSCGEDMTPGHDKDADSSTRDKRGGRDSDLDSKSPHLGYRDPRPGDQSRVIQERSGGGFRERDYSREDDKHDEFVTFNNDANFSTRDRKDADGEGDVLHEKLRALLPH